VKEKGNGFAGRRDKVARRQRSGCGNAVWEFLIEIFPAIGAGTPSLSVGDQRLSQLQAILPTMCGISSDHMPQRRKTARCKAGFSSFKNGSQQRDKNQTKYD
jgi:hypothetical protein